MSSPEEFNKAFGRVLRSLREQRSEQLGSKVSQELLGHEIESGRTYISELERGEKGPSLRMVFRLAAQLNVSPVEIVQLVEAELTRQRRKGAAKR